MTRPPLDGVRILAVSQFGAGPFGTQVLADLGAEVIKIEDPAVGGDSSRYVPPYLHEQDSLYFQSFNRGKKSLTLNLQHAAGRAVLHDLVKVSDAVFNNVRGDLPARLGLTYDELKGVNPRIVCCSLSGFGATGPRASEPGFDYLIQGYAGYMGITGEPDGPPGKCGVSVIDFAGGYAGMVGLMVGLFDAQRTGRGRDVDVSLLDTAVSMLSYFAIWTLNREWEPERIADSGHQTLVPAQNFPTRDGWIVIFCNKDKFWQVLLERMELPALGRDPRFVGFVPCAPVNSVAQALEDEQVRAREMILEIEHPHFGRIREVAGPIRTEGEIRQPAPAPALGEHTEAILSGILGYGSQTIARLRAEGVIGK